VSFDIGALRSALKTKIAAAYTTAGFSCNVYDYPPVAPIGRCVIIDLAPEAVAYHQTFSSVGVAGLELELEFRSPCGSDRDIDSLKECDGVLGVGTTGSLFDAVASDNYALSGVSGWAFVLVSANGPELVNAGEGVQSWYSVRFRASLARMKGT